MPSNLQLIHIRHLRDAQEPFSFDGRFYSILWITEGEGLARIDFQEYLLQPQRILYITPDQKGSIVHMADSGYLLMFTEELLLTASGTKRKSAVLQWTVDPCMYFDISSDQLVDFKLLWEILERNINRPGTKLLSAKIVHLLWIYPQLAKGTHSEKTASEEDADLIKRLKKLIDTYFKDQKESVFYADKLQIPLWKLNRICKEILGDTVHDILLDRTITEAKRLLLSSNRSIKEINFELGFKDPSYFNKVFKRLCGLSPRAYRARK